VLWQKFLHGFENPDLIFFEGDTVGETWGNILIKDDYNIQAEDQSSGLQQLGHSTPKQKQLRPKGLNKLRDNKKEGLNRSVQKGRAEQMGGEN
jgi:hypothetical protein